MKILKTPPGIYLIYKCTKFQNNLPSPKVKYTTQADEVKKSNKYRTKYTTNLLVWRYQWKRNFHEQKNL